MNKEKLEDLWYDFKSIPIHKKVIFIFVLVAGIILSFLMVVYFAGNLFQVLNFNNKEEPFEFVFTRPEILKLVIMAYLVMIVLITYVFVRNKIKNSIVFTDDRGVKILKNATKDNSRFMTKEEIKSAFTVGNLKEINTTIYGRLGKEGNKDIVARMINPPKNKAEGNKNDLIIASMGSGKTFTYVINELIQTVLRGDSFVASDPKGELFQTLAPFCEKMGVETHVLAVNGADNPYSECWNCLKETINPDTERLDDTRLTDFVNIYMQNTENGSTKTDFWYSSSLNITTLVISYIGYKREMAIQNGYIQLYKKIADTTDQSPTIQRWKAKTISFKKIKDIILKTAITNGYDKEEIINTFHYIENNASEYDFTMKEVFNGLLDFGEIESDVMKIMNEVPTDHPLFSAYKMYLTNTKDTVKDSALQGTQLRFSLFKDTSLREVLSHDGIDLSTINKKQTAVFVIMSDKVDTYKPITSLFFSFLFKDIMEIYDKEQNIAGETGTKNPCLGVTAMLEEFYSIGVISGSPETFGKTMATCRSRQLFVKVIIQYYRQLEALYGVNIKDAIQGGCDSLIYLGGNDLSTLNFISEFAGNSTVQSESHQESESIITGVTNSTINVSENVRALLTVSELRMWRNKVLLIKHGELPAKLNPFPWIDHWVVKEGLFDTSKKASLYTRCQPIQERVEIWEEESQKSNYFISKNTADEGEKEKFETRYEPPIKDVINLLQPTLKAQDLEDTQELHFEYDEESDTLYDTKTGEVFEKSNKKTEEDEIVLPTIFQYNNNDSSSSIHLINNRKEQKSKKQTNKNAKPVDIITPENIDSKQSSSIKVRPQRGRKNKRVNL